MAAQIAAQIARFAGARETWTAVVAPVAMVVGFVGYHAEDYLKSDTERARVRSVTLFTLRLIVSIIIIYNFPTFVLLAHINTSGLRRMLKDNSNGESSTDLRVQRELEVS